MPVFVGDLPPANRTRLPLPIGEVFAVDHAVAANAESLAVGNVKAKLREVCPRLKMVGMKLLAVVAALLAGIVVSLVDLLSPKAKLAGHASALTDERVAVFPVWRVRPYLKGRFARMVAELLSRVSTGNLKGLGAVSADARWDVSPATPAILAAIARGLGSVSVHVIKPSALLAGESNLTSAWGRALPFHEYHAISIPQRDSCRKYVDVILEATGETFADTAAARGVAIAGGE
jgi:hypothetical protein